MSISQLDHAWKHSTQSNFPKILNLELLHLPLSALQSYLQLHHLRISRKSKSYTSFTTICRDAIQLLYAFL